MSRAFSKLLNVSTGAVIAARAEVADTRAARRKGLLGRASMDAGAALVLSPCWMIHTAFMRFAIDVVFLDGNGVVRRLVRHLRPWRIAIAPAARSVIELPADALSALDLRVGDRVTEV